MEEISLTVPEPPPNSTPPFLIAFPPGCNPRVSKQQLKINVEAHAAEKKGNMKVITIDTPAVTLRGTTFSKETIATRQSKYALCLINPKTHVAKVLATPQIIPLEFHIKGEDKQTQETKRAIEDRAKADAALTADFGSKQRRQQKDKLVAFGIKDKLIDTTISNASVPDLLAGKEGEFGPILDRTEAIMADIPPHNLNAETPAEAYPIDGLIPPDMMAQVPLGRILQLTEDDTKKLSAHLFPRFTVSRLKRLGDIEDQGEKERLAKMLIYYTYIWRLLRCSHRVLADPGTLNSEVRIHPPILSYLMEHYTDAQFKDGAMIPVMTAPLRSKLQLVLGAIALHIDHFHMPIEEFAGDLEMHPTACAPLFKALGASVESGKRRRKTQKKKGDEGREGKEEEEDADPDGRMMVRLKVPLVFPRLTNKKKQ